MRFGIFQCRIHLSCELLAALRTSYRHRIPKPGEPEGEPSRTLSLRHLHPVARLGDAARFTSRTFCRQSALRGQSKRRQAANPEARLPLIIPQSLGLDAVAGLI